MSENLRTLPTVDLSMLLNQASHAVNNRLARALAEVGISVKVYCALKKAVEGDFTQAQLAELAWMDKTTMVTFSTKWSETASPRGRCQRRIAGCDWWRSPRRAGTCC